MRIIKKIEYKTFIESDVDQENIYAFKYGKNIAVLSRKQDKFYWKSLQAVNIVWYQESETIEEAIENLIKSQDYKDYETSDIIEFDSTKEFIGWAYNELYNLSGESGLLSKAKQFQKEQEIKINSNHTSSDYNTEKEEHILKGINRMIDLIDRHNKEFV